MSQKWISVENGFPPDEWPVAIAIKGWKRATVGNFVGRRSGKRYLSRPWRSRGVVVEEEVTHWMPLSKPPTPEPAPELQKEKVIGDSQ